MFLNSKKKQRISILMELFLLARLLFYSFFFFILTRTTSATFHTLSPNRSLRDQETLVSASQNFELGFFSISNSNHRFLGLWYKKISPRTIVWIANRDTPVSNTAASLNFTSQGNLVLVNSTNHIFWSSNLTMAVKNPVAQLLDSGNFVIRDANDSNPDNFRWQSFDYPGDTFLAGMKLGTDLVTGHERFMSSWKDSDDPSQGQFSIHLELKGYPQMILRKDNVIQYRSGSWNGVRFTGTPFSRPDPIFTREFVMNDKEVFFRFNVRDKSSFARQTLTSAGISQRLVWSDRQNDWISAYVVQRDQCENYGFCGAYANCEINNNIVCSCLDGFIPRAQEDWKMQIWSDGCVRRMPLNCSIKDGFVKLTGVKLPDTSSTWYDKRMSLKECENMCLRNCSCSAYANLDIRNGGSGCLIWFNELIDIRGLDGGQDLYVRLAASELVEIRKKRSIRKKIAGIVAAAAATVGISMLIIVFCIWRRNVRIRKQGIKKDNQIQETENINGNEDIDFLMFDFTAIFQSTSNFSGNNKLGEGGFGPVYKGILTDGQVIAVKRLSKDSLQGMIEFKKEMILISKLQHRNLVKLLGCCIQDDEKILVYEFMPNKSLDYFIFDQTRSKLLDWDKRMIIIDGIARGLLYLHEDSRLRIIHRDLKASNVLLDKDMNPKISDFGLARTFGGDQSRAKTNKVAGTYGYMSPEYTIDGLFSKKSDVFSFGVLVLEIVSGKRNRAFFHVEHDHNLLGHAWKLWIEERPLELVDNTLDYFPISQMLRCINAGLLCVQQRPEDRPNMSSVVVMLSSETPLPWPKQPGFFIERNMPKPESSSHSNNESSLNRISSTFTDGR